MLKLPHGWPCHRHVSPELHASIKFVVKIKHVLDCVDDSILL